MRKKLLFLVPVAFVLLVVVAFLFNYLGITIGGIEYHKGMEGYVVYPAVSLSWVILTIILMVLVVGSYVCYKKIS